MTTSKLKSILPRYQQVAVAVAGKIAANEYKVGDKLHARSRLANHYSVSPETARKALSVLVDLEIVHVKHGSGFYVASDQLAQDFVNQYRDVQSIQELKQEMTESMRKQQAELVHFSKILEQLTSKTSHFNSSNPLTPFQLEISDKALYLEETVGEINLWQHTAATLVAIQRADELVVSPGPYAQIMAGDIIFLVGNEFCQQRATNFFYPTT